MSDVEEVESVPEESEEEESEESEECEETGERKPKKKSKKKGKGRNAGCCMPCGGLALLVLAIANLGNTELDYLRNHALLLEASEDTVDVPCTLDPANEGKLVFISCPVSDMHDFKNDYPNVTSLVNDNLAGAWFSVRTEIFQYEEEENRPPRKSDDEDQDGSHGGKGKKRKTQNKGKRKGGRAFLQKASQQGQGPGEDGEDGDGHDEEHGGQDGDQNSDTSGPTYVVRQSWVPKAGKESFHCTRKSQPECDFQGFEPGAVKNRGSIPEGLQSGDMHAPAFSVAVGNSKGKSSYKLNDMLIKEVKSKKLLVIRKGAHLHDGHVSWTASDGRDDDNMTVFRQSPGTQTEIGDLRVRFEKSGDLSTLSIVAKQGQDGKLEAATLTDKSGKEGLTKVNWLEEGEKSKSEFFLEKLNENTANTYALRVGSFFLIWLALYLITSPLAAAPKLIPFIGRMISGAVGCVLCSLNFFVAGAITLITIAIAWVMFKPLVAAAIFAGVGALLACAVVVSRWMKKDTAKKKLLGKAKKKTKGYGAAPPA
mmetsp:Transcript_38273/g.68432  ORF Transcript_38273/g.68432 Transcript_38273/m.68432 type:complete len:538 (+) Transcript_38273:103-1716(+)